MMTPLEQQAYTVVRQAESASRLWQDIIALAEQGAIKAALELCEGNQTDAAALLGLNRNTFRERVGRYNLRGYGMSKTQGRCKSW